VLLAAVGLLGACQEEVNGPGNATGEMLDLESPIVFGMVAFMSTEGVRTGRVEADTAYTYADSTKVDLRHMTAYFYDESGTEKATVTGREGEWDQETNRMIARGEVVLLIHSDGSKIESAEINYDPSIDRVWSDSATVQTLANGSVTTGTSFEADVDFTNVVVRNPRGGGGRLRL
jgi:LPS export ABC transporter protein LptC